MSNSGNPRKSWFLAVVLAWAIPGLGHWYLGRRGKAVAFFVLVAGLLVAGWVLGQCKVVDFDDTWMFAGQAPAGLVTVAAELIGDTVRASGGPADPVPQSYRSGGVYTLVAGLLNLLVMLDAYIVANNIRRPTQTEGE